MPGTNPRQSNWDGDGMPDLVNTQPLQAGPRQMASDFQRELDRSDPCEVRFVSRLGTDRIIELTLSDCAKEQPATSGTVGGLLP